MDTPTSVMLDIDGTPTPVEDAAWLLLAPCGCCIGLTHAVRDDKPVVTEEQAMNAFDWPGGKTRKLAQAGYRMVACRRDSIGHDVHEQLKGNCPHDPPYGKEPTVIPGGYAWAARASSATRHLVPGEKDGRHGPSLCDRVQGFWSVWPSLNLDTVECTHCQREANKIYGGAA